MENKNKILFLPHCMIEGQKERAVKLADELNYDVYVLAGGSIMKKILKNYDLNKVDKIVGVACLDEIGLVKNHFSQTPYLKKVFPVELVENGCKDTYCSFKELEKILRS